MTDSTGLTGNAAAGYTANDIELFGGFGKCERLTNDELEGFKTEIIVNVSAVDRDFAGACIYANSCD